MTLAQERLEAAKLAVEKAIEALETLADSHAPFQFDADLSELIAFHARLEQAEIVD